MTNQTDSYSKAKRLLLEEGILHLRRAEKVNGSLNYKINQQLSHSYILIVVTSGSGTLMLDEKELSMRNGAYFLCPPDHTFGVSEFNEELELFLFSFDIYQHDIGNSEEMVIVKNDNLLEVFGESAFCPQQMLGTKCESISSHWNSEQHLATYLSNLEFQELIYFLLIHSEVEQDLPLYHLETIKNYIEHHFHENLSNDYLADMCKLSPKYFSDQFKRVFGKSAMEYVTELRMSMSKELMRGKTIKLKDIAKKVGYDDEFYFSRKFKKEIGVAPSAYIKSRLRKIAVFDNEAAGHLLALNIIPYAAPLHPKWTEYYYKRYRRDIPVHLSAYRKNADWRSNIRRLVQSKPDLLICTHSVSEEEEQVLRDTFSNLYILQKDCIWQEQFVEMAHFLGETAVAERWLHLFNHKVKRGREYIKKNHLDQQKVVILRLFKNKLYLHSNKRTNSVFFEDFMLSPGFDTSSPNMDLAITPSELMALNPDILLMLICQESETISFWEELQSSQAWHNLKAVRHGHLFFLKSDPWLEYSPIAQSRKVDQALDILSGICP
ncbi:AraC family transcriptional regulator [Metabacillus idriensis]|uniref:AraC family transcriptional regulator n=1 Tax=Metabacillus idriensis TaxID=324768 RepID=UPI00174810C1|nr:AraC family transcriptional regulator [Metabacillus idriensis]